jgi:short-subunit dehydrogenase
MINENMPVIIVTGASRGLGAAVARWLAKARSAVTLISRSENRLKDVAEEIRSLGGSHWC